jgi:hypothetical protein
MPIRQTLTRVIYSFPIQLVLMHFKKNQIMMLYWLILYGFITQTIASRFGISYLFLDPEYLGNTGARPFFIIGIALGAFIMAFNISSYILNSFRFPFLATLSKTFIKYSFNNFIIPLSFLLIYCYRIFHFQYYSQLESASDIAISIFAFLLGVTVVLVITFRYFMYTNKDIYKLFGVEHSDSDSQSHQLTANNLNLRGKKWRVDTYLIFPAKVKIVRDTRHYKKYMLESVFRQNHVNAAVVELVVFATFIVLGTFRDYSYFRIPAGASVLLLFTMFIMLSGVFRYWLKAWANTALVLLFLGLNYISQFETLNPRNQAYGLNYNGKLATYSRQELEESVTDSLYTQDTIHTIRILEKWKKYWNDKGVDRPKFVLLNVSGGGLRSCVFTFRSLQIMDSIYQGELLKHVALISGSSGGMISATYYRELYLNHNKELQHANRTGDPYFIRNSGKDLLNCVAFSATVSDLFMNMQTFSDGRNRYIKDRAYAWEQQLSENYNHVLDKRLGDYYEPEVNAQIPMLIMSPTIINDGRALHISAQPMSYMLQSPKHEYGSLNQAANGVEFSRFFKNQNASNLKISSALRMNSSFPYIMPSVSLPSEPALEVMDAGIRDNYGIVNSTQFLYTFKDWIAANTSGVVVLQIRDTHKQQKVENNSIKSIMEKVMAPLRNLSGNFLIMQDYTFDRSLEYAQSWYKGPLDYIIIQMPEMEDKISLSWHLTEKEKKFLKSAPLNQQNSNAIKRLQELVPTSN